jgi:peptidoglycan/xylan/chitin deacetylase (PgdA/CDA1 family)
MLCCHHSSERNSTAKTTVISMVTGLPFAMPHVGWSAMAVDTRDAGLSRTPLVFRYHSVEPYASDPFGITVHPRRFDRHMRWLNRSGLRGVSMHQLLRAHRDNRQHGLVGLTFDGGYTDFVTEVMPILARYGFSATVFVVARLLGGHNKWDQPGPHKSLMTASDVWRAAAAGMEIGSHSLTHQRLPDSDERVLQDEVRRSRALLSELTGQDVTGFCYPYGEVTAREVAAVRSAGYDYACALRRTPNASLYAIPRTQISDRDRAAHLFAKWAKHECVGLGGGR